MDKNTVQLYHLRNYITKLRILSILALLPLFFFFNMVLSLLKLGFFSSYSTFASLGLVYFPVVVFISSPVIVLSYLKKSINAYSSQELEIPPLKDYFSSMFFYQVIFFLATILINIIIMMCYVADGHNPDNITFEIAVISLIHNAYYVPLCLGACLITCYIKNSVNNLRNDSNENIDELLKQSYSKIKSRVGEDREEYIKLILFNLIYFFSFCVFNNIACWLIGDNCQDASEQVVLRVSLLYGILSPCVASVFYYNYITYYDGIMLKVALKNLELILNFLLLLLLIWTIVSTFIFQKSKLVYLLAGNNMVSIVFNYCLYFIVSRYNKKIQN